MSKETSCPICGTEATVHRTVIEGYQQGNTYAIQECLNCNTSFTIPHKSSDNIYQLIYKNAERVPGYSRYFEYAGNVSKSKRPFDYLANKEAMYWSVKKMIRDQRINNNAKILEVGSGLGYLTYALSKENYNITGVDISATAVDAAIKNFGNLFLCKNIFEMGDEYKNHFDLIIMTEVLEHVETPVAFIECLVEMLNDNGKLFGDHSQ